MSQQSKHTQWLGRELRGWVKDGIIEEDTAEKLRVRYPESPSRSSSQALVRILAIIGSLLIGLGIILVFAYNWNDLSKTGKLVLSFVPLGISLFLSVFTLLRRFASAAWRESVSILVGLTIAACIGLVGQTLHIQSDLSEFYFVWLLACIPFLWALRSRSLFCLLSLLTVLWISSTNNYQETLVPLRYWIVTVPILAYLLFERRLAKSRLPLFVFAASQVWAFSVLGTIQFSFITPAFWAATTFVVFYLWDTRIDLNQAKLKSHPAGIVSKLGITFVAYVLSFDDAWNLGTGDHYMSVLGIASIAVYALAYLFFVVERLRVRSWMEIPWTVLPVLILLLSFDSVKGDGVAIVFNLYVLVLAVFAIIDGYRSDSMSRLNHGLIIILVLAVTRFFSGDFGMLARGMVFIGVGVGFLFANFHFIKRRKEGGNESV